MSNWLDSLLGLNTLFQGGEITKHIRETPGLAREMRYSRSNAFNQDAQDYLGPLAAFDFARHGGAGGKAAAAFTPAYAAGKAADPKLMSKWLGTGEALPSMSHADQIQNAFGGAVQSGFDSLLSWFD
jgi:hypothetical protein